MVKINEINERRSSSRIKTLESNKAAVRQRKKEEAVAAAVVKKPVKKKQRVKDTRGDVYAGLVLNVNENEKVVEVTERGSAVGEGVVDVERSGSEVYAKGAGASADGVESKKSAYTRVKDTIRSFYKHYLHFVQEEETRCKKADDEEKKLKKPKANAKKGEKSCNHEDEKTSPKKLKSNNKDEVEEKTKAKRPDLKSLSLMQKSNLTLVPKNRMGSVPGVDVGHQFFSRCEMVTVGFHNHWLCGIDYIGVGQQKEYPEYTLPITVAIVMSGMYEDDVDNSADVVYTGQGGNDLLGNKRQIGDQVMARGNLGLKHSMDQNVPVRVIRGHESKTSYVGKVYTYDGLYKVVEYWAEKGKSGFTVYKFKLKRIPGQPQLVTQQVFFTRGAIPDSVAELQGLVCEDISGGLENIPIPATNVVDDPPVPPTGLTYIRDLQFANNVIPPSSASGCNCKGSCTDPKSCACARLNGFDFPYVYRDGGRLIEPKAVVFECGPHCGCGPSCVNRTTQRGLKHRLEVYKTSMKGWAVRSWDFIPSGAFVCEYIGVLRKGDVHNPDNMYIMDIDCLETIQGLGQREKRLGDVPISMQDSEAGTDNVQFCIDAGTVGNVTRYINHSCQPNLFVQCVLSAHHDITQARVILFAADNIQPLKELTYDYGYALDSVVDSDGNIKELPCYCGAPDCRKRMF
nr:histone-lysine N-methyltransferase, H3 lysine-9 specific SUVH4 isoform X1 [Tanacetum cinerariifolium]